MYTAAHLVFASMLCTAGSCSGALLPLLIRRPAPPQASYQQQVQDWIMPVSEPSTRAFLALKANSVRGN